jgi:hypothetical protein
LAAVGFVQEVSPVSAKLASGKQEHSSKQATFRVEYCCSGKELL